MKINLVSKFSRIINDFWIGFREAGFLINGHSFVTTLQKSEPLALFFLNFDFLKELFLQLKLFQFEFIAKHLNLSRNS
jgi:hypothetical protein